MKVSDALFKEWFAFGIMRLIECMDVDPTLAFVAVAGPYEVNWCSLGLHDWISYECKTGKLFRVGG